MVSISQAVPAVAMCRWRSAFVHIRYFQEHITLVTNNDIFYEIWTPYTATTKDNNWYSMQYTGHMFHVEFHQLRL